MKAVNFEEYLQWFNNHPLVSKAQKANRIKFGATEADAKRLLEMARTAIKTANDKGIEIETDIKIVDDYLRRNIKTVTVRGSDGQPGSIGVEEEFDFVLKYLVNKDGGVMLKYHGSTIEPAVPFQNENGEEDGGIGGQWETMGEVDGGENIDATEWNVVYSLRSGALYLLQWQRNISCNS